MPNPKKEYLHDILSELHEVPTFIQVYADFLLNKIAIGKLIFKGARANLRTAVDVCQFNKINNSNMLTQKQIERYVKARPASRKKLVSFVCFLNNYYDCKLILRTCDKPIKRKKIL